MSGNFTKSERDVVIFHLIFSALCVVVLALPVGVKVGTRLLFLVILYNVSLPIFGVVRGYKDWVEIWLFAFILSIFQVMPDWFLSAILGVLIFPEDGLFKIGAVSAYMAGLWSIPIFLIIFTGVCVQRRASNLVVYLTVAIVSLVIFGGSEQTLWLLGSWYAKGVTMIGHSAIYILIPEVILGVMAYSVFTMIRGKNHWVKVPGASVVMLIYLGSASLFYLIFEGLIFN